MTPTTKRASRERVEQIEQDARRSYVKYPAPAKFRMKWRAREAENELRRRGSDV